MNEGARNEQEARRRLEGAVARLRAALEEARNHLMDARASRDDKESFQSSLDAAEDVLGDADEVHDEAPPPEALTVSPQFLHDARHAIRGALAGTVGHLDLLASGALTDEHAVQESLQAALEAATSADRFIHEFFDIAVARAEEPRIPMRPVLTRALVDEVVQLAQAHAESHDVRLRTQVSSRTRRMRIDPDGLQQMLELMIDHAIDAAPQRGDVRINVHDSRKGGTRIEVSHAGRCPTPPERHFTPFEPTAGHAPHGLAAVMHLAQMRAGSAGVAPAEPRGEVLWVELPQWQEPERTAEHPPEPQQETVTRPAGPAPRILIVEDDRQERESLRSILESAGYQVTTAANVEQALEWVHEHDFDAITLDLLLGRNYSLQVLSAARTGRNAASAVLVLSATRPGNVAFPYPIQGHLQKPVSRRMLLRALRWSQVPPPVAGPVLYIGTEPPSGLEPALRERGRRLLHAQDATQAKALLEEAPGLVVLDPKTPVDKPFLDGLEGAPLVLWGDPGSRRVRHNASATVDPAAGVAVLLGEIERIRREQDDLEAVDSGP